MATVKFAPHQLTPRSRTTSLFKDPQTPPNTSQNPTAKLWDEYEKRSLDNTRRCETTCTGMSSFQPLQSQRFFSGTVLDMVKSYDFRSLPKILRKSPPVSTTSNPKLDFGSLESAHSNVIPNVPYSTTVAKCKTCNQSIMSTPNICEKIQ